MYLLLLTTTTPLHHHQSVSSFRRFQQGVIVDVSSWYPFSALWLRTMAQAIYAFIHRILSVHLPFATDCTAAIQCPPSRSCTYRGGFYIYCKDSKLLIELIEENLDVIFSCILAALFSVCFLVFLWKLCKKVDMDGRPARAKAL